MLQSRMVFPVLTVRKYIVMSPPVNQTGRSKSYIRNAKHLCAVFNHVPSHDPNIDKTFLKPVPSSNDLPHFNVMGGVCTID